MAEMMRMEPRKHPVTQADLLCQDPHRRYIIKMTTPKPNPRIEHLIDLYERDFHDQYFHLTTSWQLKRFICRHHGVRKADFDAAFIAWLLRTKAAPRSSGFDGEIGPYRPTHCSHFSSGDEEYRRVFHLRINQLQTQGGDEDDEKN